MATHRWIVVADSPFLPATGGGELEHLGLLTALARRGRLALAVVPGVIDPARYVGALGGVSVLGTPRLGGPARLVVPATPYPVACRPAPPGLAARARALAPDATAVIVGSPKSRAVGEALARGLDLPAVLRQHNREGAYHRALARHTGGPRGLLLRREARRIEADELRLARAGWVVGTADISALDAAWRRTVADHPVLHVPPFALHERVAAAGEGAAGEGAGGPPRVVFVGTLDIATNVAALRWFLDRVWPRVRAGHPGAVLDVVGRRPPSGLVRSLHRAEGVRLIADAPDATAHLRGARVAVNPGVPGPEATGVNIKVIEYLVAGLPVVSTSSTPAALGLRAGGDLLVHDDAEGFAAAVLALLADPDGARALAAWGRARLAELLDADRGLDLLATLVEG